MRSLIFCPTQFCHNIISAQKPDFHLTGYSTRCFALSELSSLGVDNYASPRGVLVDKRVEKIIEMMREDVRGELSLTEFAQSVNLSVWRLCHIFKSDVGMPPIRYLRLLRMERAKGLLESSFLSVKEIAFQVGLNDESHFVRDFKSTYGFSPASIAHSSSATATRNGNGRQWQRNRQRQRSAKQA